MWWSFGYRVSLGLLLLAQPGFSCELAVRDRVERLTAKLQGEGAAISVVAAQSKVGAPWLINLAGDRYFVPASLVKLFTTAAALELIQPNFRISTKLWGSGLKDGRVARLILEGNGDPSFNSEQLQRLVKQLTQAGVKRVGTIQLRDRLSAKLPSGWEWQDLVEEYGAVPHGLVINFNALAWQLRPGKNLRDPVIFQWQTPELALGWQVENRALTVKQGRQIQVERQLDQPKLIITGELALNGGLEQGATVVLDPRANFQQHLELELKRQGIWLENQLRLQSEPAQPPEKLPEKLPEQILAVVDSPTLEQLVSTTNKDSENLYAENLRLILGNQLAQLWSKWQIEAQDLRLVDGSGLARRNSLKPRAVVQLLQGLANNSRFRNSLAIAGRDGTLKSRLAGTQIIAKTGTLDGVAALAGYMLGEPELAFAIIINHGSTQPRNNRQVLDAIALELYRSRSCHLN